jgi:hypothetical protein
MRWLVILGLLPLPVWAQNAPSPQRIEVPLDLDHPDSSVKMSFGSIGIDGHAGDSRQHPYFTIPAERPGQQAPGILIHIPLGD